MSDLTQLLSSMTAVAAADYGKTIAPVLSQAATQLASTPVAAPSIGVSILGELSTAGVQIAADEAGALVSWINTEVAKLAAKVSAPAATTATTATTTTTVQANSK